MDNIDNVKNNELLRSYDKTIHDLRNARQVDVIQYELAQMDIAELKRENSALKAIIAEQNKVIGEKDELLARIGAEYEEKHREMIG